MVPSFHILYYVGCILYVRTLDLSPSRAGQHIGQCVSSNHLCPPLHREHLPTSVPTSVPILVVCSALWTHIAGPWCLCYNHCFSISFPTFRIQHLLCPYVFRFSCRSCCLMTSRSPRSRSPPPSQSAPLLSIALYVT